MTAALLFVVLVAIAIQLYPGYRYAEHFLSDLGATRTWHGESNQAAALVFAIAVAIVGVGMIVFAGSWRDFAFEQRRARTLGRIGHVCGTVSGLAFVGVAGAPMNIALDAHNALVVVAFALLLAFAASMTIVWAKNGAPRGVIVAGLAYAALLAVFFASAVWVVATDFWTHRHIIIVGQKISVAASMAYVVYLTLTIRRRS